MPPEKRRRVVSTADLEDLHPYLMYGALLSFLKAWGNSLGLVGPALLSWQLAAGLALTAVALHAVLGVAVVAGAAIIVFALSEAVFSVWLRLVRRHVQQVRPLADRLPAPGPDGVQAVWQRTLEVVEECASWSNQGRGGGRTPTEWLEGWFLGAPLARILHGNMLEFIAWAFYTRRTEELDQEQRTEATAILRTLEKKFGWAFAAGMDPAVKPIRINFDQLHVWCHPLTYYCGLRVLRVGASQTLRLMGFSHRQSSSGRLSFFHYAPVQPEPGALFVNGEPSGRTPRPPIVFIHGLGVGLSPYLRFIRRLAGGSRECFVVELPEVSQTGTRMVLQPDTMAEEVADMLRTYGHQSACFIAHSYGTFVLSWVLRAQRSIVAQMVLLDPVCFLLAQPDVAFNFLYRQPRSAFSFVVANFVRWELFSANVLMRHFYWYHNVMWREELPPDCVIALSGKDDIIDPVAVRHYLEGWSRQASDSGRQVKLLWYDSFFHGEVLLSKAAQVQIMELM